MSKLRFLLVCVMSTVGMLAVINFAQAAPRYVDDSGDDDSGNNSCLVEGSPCLTISQAYDEADAGDTIDVGAGEYTISAAMDLQKANLTIQGQGRGITTVDCASTGIFSVQETGIIIEDFTITASDENCAPISTPEEVKEVGVLKIRNNTFTNTSGGDIRGVWIAAETTGTDIDIYNNIFYSLGNNAAIFVQGNDLPDVDIYNNTIYSGGTVGIQGGAAGGDFEVYNNIIHTASYGLVFSTGTLTSSYNMFYNISTSNIIGSGSQVLPAQTGDISADPAFVSIELGSEDFNLQPWSEAIAAAQDGTTDFGALDFTGTATSSITVGSGAENYSTISGALAAISGSTARTVAVSVGSYAENVTMKSNVTMTGTGSPTINPGSGIGIALSSVDDSSISGFTISTVGHGVSVSSGSGNTLSGLTISASAGDGINLSSTSNNTISSCNISNSLNGISITGGTGNALSGNTVTSGSTSGGFVATASPLVVGGTDYTFINSGDGAFWYSDTSTEYEILADDTTLTGADGTVDINVGACLIDATAFDLGLLYATMYHLSTMADSYGELETFWDNNFGDGAGTDLTIDCSGYYKSDVFTAAGASADYVYAGDLVDDFDTTATVVSGFTTPPAFTFAYSYSGLNLSNATVTSTSDTFTSNGKGLNITGTSVLTTTNGTATDNSLNLAYSSSGTSKMINTDFEHDSDTSLTSISGDGTVNVYYRTRAYTTDFGDGTVTWTTASGGTPVDSAASDIEPQDLSSGYTEYVTPLAYTLNSSGYGINNNDFVLIALDTGVTGAMAYTLDTVNETVAIVVGGPGQVQDPPQQPQQEATVPVPDAEDPDPDTETEEAEGQEGGIEDQTGLPAAGGLKLVKLSGHPAVYLADPATGERKPIFNDKIFEAHGLNWDDVEEVGLGEMAKYALAKPLIYPNGSVVKFSDRRVYEIRNGYELHWIPTEEEFEKDHEWSDIRVLPDSLMPLFEIFLD